MSNPESRCQYSSEAIPEILRIGSNRRKLGGFPLRTYLTKRVDPEPANRLSKLNIGYFVNKDMGSEDFSKGKIYRRVGGGDVVSISIPFTRFAGLTCRYHYSDTFPFIEVNRTYGVLGKITVGNAHSTGWLLRDLCNIHLLRNGYCLMHGAGLRSETERVALIGLSNTGKSTTTFNLVKHAECQIYGDDLIATDGFGLYSCPFTNTNISPSSLPTLKKQVSHWAARNVPFYENFGPSSSYPLHDYVGQENMARAGEKATKLVFLRRGDHNKMRKLSSEEAITLLAASNRTEFTFMNSPIFSAFDYLCGADHIQDALDKELNILDKLVANTESMLIEGGPDYFREIVSDIILTAG